MRRLGSLFTYLLVYPVIGVLVSIGGIFVLEAGSWIFSYSFPLSEMLLGIEALSPFMKYLAALTVGWVSWVVVINLLFGAVDTMSGVVEDHTKQ